MNNMTPGNNHQLILEALMDAAAARSIKQQNRRYGKQHHILLSQYFFVMHEMLNLEIS